MDASGTTAYVARILNAGYTVRMYPRPIQRAARAAAIAQLGRIVREAFNACDDYEALLQAVLDALAPREERRF